MSLLRSCLCRTPRLASHLAVASIRYSSTESIPITPVLSIVHHPYELPTSAIQANDPNAKFAVFEFSGTQYKVTVDDVIVADYIENVDIGQTISMDKVLLVGLKDSTFIGRPYIAGARVTATVEERARDKKVIIFKMRRRKNSKRTRGFRRQVTILRINEIAIEQV